MTDSQSPPAAADAAQARFGLVGRTALVTGGTKVPRPWPLGSL
jgi:hypothetical protein